MGLVIKKKPILATSSVVHSEGGQVVTEQHQQEEVAPPPGATPQALSGAKPGPADGPQLGGPHATIDVSTSLTINLGKYNSVKVAVGITLPAALNELDDVFEYGRAWMNTKMEQLAADVSPDAPAED